MIDEVHLGTGKESTNGRSGVGPANGLRRRFANSPNAQPEGSASLYSKFWAALRATVPIAPFTAVGVTIFAYTGAYKLPDKLPALLVDNSAVVVGFLAAVLVWVILAIFYSPYTGADSVSRRNYNLLRERLDRLNVRLKHARPKGYEPHEETSHFRAGKGCGCEALMFRETRDGWIAMKPTDDKCRCESELSAVRRLAFEHAKRERDQISREINSAGMAWTSGLGYIEL